MILKLFTCSVVLIGCKVYVVMKLGYIFVQDCLELNEG